MRLPRARAETAEAASEADGNGRVAAALPGVRPQVSRLALLTREPWLVLGPLVVIQWLALLAFALSVPRNGWLFYQGGDETFFYTDSWVLAHGHIPESRVGFAWSFLLAPLPALVGPSFLAAVPVIVLLQVLVLAPVALLAMYGIGARLGGRAIGYGAAALWVAAPFLSIPLFVDRYHEKFVEQFLPQAFGLTGLGDYPSTVALLVAGYFLVRCLDTHAPSEAVLAGVAAGFAIGIKPANALFLAGPGLAFLVARRWREGAAFAAAMVPAGLALLIWKARGLGYIPILTPDSQALAAGAGALGVPDSHAPLAVVVSRYVELDWDQLHANYRYLREVFWSTRLVQWLPIAGMLAVARLSWSKALLLGGWLGAFVLVKGSSTEASLEQGTLLRLIMPALPPFVLLAAAIPLLVPQIGPRIAARFPVRTRGLPLRSAPVIAAVVAFALVPLAVIAALPPLQDGRAAMLSAQSVFVPVDEEFGLRATPSPTGGIDLTWTRSEDGPTSTFYTVHRSKAEFKIPKGSPEDFPLVREGLLCESRHGGADKCTIEMDQVATTRERLWHDAPEPGRWTYRIGIAANWLDDEGRGDTLFLSRPLTVTIP